MYTIGFLELSSIAQGIEVTDKILKAAETELIFAREGCPGKFYILFKGEVESVNTSMKTGVEASKHYCIDSTVIPNVHPDVIKGINSVSEPKSGEAVGVMEFFSVAAAVKAADTAVKSAAVSIMNLRIGTGIGGKSFVVISGDIGALKSALRAVSGDEELQGSIINAVAIASPASELMKHLY